MGINVVHFIPVRQIANKERTGVPEGNLCLDAVVLDNKHKALHVFIAI
jgi:hypothetical protein